MVNMNVLKGSSVLKRYDDISTFAPWEENKSQAAQCIGGPILISMRNINPQIFHNARAHR